MKIFDTSSIVCILMEAKCPKVFDVCKKHGYELCITKDVYNELKRNPETFKRFQSFSGFTILDDIDDSCTTKLSKRHPWLHSGELSVLCAGFLKSKKNENYHCIIDERARNLKEKYKLNINGTIGLLLWQRDQLFEISSYECSKLYDNIKKSPFRINENILAELLK